MLDQPDIIKIKDREIKVEGLTTEIVGMYERYMQSELLDAIRSKKPQLAEDYLPLLQKHYTDLKYDLLNFGGVKFWDFISVPINFIYLLWLCMSKHQQIDKEVVQEWAYENHEDAEELWKWLMSSKKKG